MLGGPLYISISIEFSAPRWRRGTVTASHAAVPGSITDRADRCQPRIVRDMYLLIFSGDYDIESQQRLEDSTCCFMVTAG
jgi:hypothetical protein